MNEQQKLTIKMALLFLIVFVFFGVIIVKEKFEVLFIPKVEKIFNTYLKDNYESLNYPINKNKITYKNNTFKIKITSPENKNLYFYLTYSDKKVKDTYKKDYVEGASLITHISKSIKKDISEKTNEDVKIIIDKKLTDFPENVQTILLTKNNYSSLKIYNIKKELIAKKWDYRIVSNNILSFVTILQENNITPKSYSFTITDENDLTKTVYISNLTEETIKKDDFDLIIKDILENNNSTILRSNNITFKYS